MSNLQTNPLDDNSGEFDYHLAEVAQHSQASVDAKSKWSMISNEQNLKGLIVGLLAKLDEKYQVRS